MAKILVGRKPARVRETDCRDSSHHYQQLIRQTRRLKTTVHPVHLSDVQRSLSPKALLIEYVLAERNSYAFAITRTSVTPYHLPAKTQIESDSNLYRKEIRAQKADLALAQRLFTELLNPIKEYHQKTDLVIVPDSSLH